MRYVIVHTRSKPHSFSQSFYYVMDNETDKRTESGTSISEALDMIRTSGFLYKITLSDMRIITKNPALFKVIYQGDELPTRKSHPEYFI